MNVAIAKARSIATQIGANAEILTGNAIVAVQKYMMIAVLS